MNFVKAVLERARVEPGIGVTSDIWNQDDWLLGAPHTTYNLSNGELVSNEPKNHISKTTGVDARGDCPRWHAFIDEITEGDVALALYLQKVAGYCLTGSTREQALFFLHGPGGNGKTVFVETLASVMGDYAMAAPPETFAIGGFDRHPTEIAGMMGARLVYASETEEGRRWNAARIKQLTGGDRITARFMRQDFFEFTPHFKVLILGNHKPTLTDVTDGERRRLHVIPLQFVPQKPDRDLPAKLQLEHGGILEWMIEGAHIWNSEGLSKPPIVAEATDEYFADQDLFRQWLDDECLCEPENESLYTSSKELYRSWQACMQAAGEDAGTRKSFGDRLRRANLKPTTKRIGNSATKVWLGIQLNNVRYDNYHDR